MRMTLLVSCEDILLRLKKSDESIDIESLTDFRTLYSWLLDKGIITNNAAVIIILDGAAYLILAEFPSTTFVVKSDEKLVEDDFSFIGVREMFGNYKAEYTFLQFIRESLSWFGGLVISSLALLAVKMGDLQALIDKTIDVAAISAAFFPLFLSFKVQTRNVDLLYFKKGEYRKHFDIDRYSLILIGSSLSSSIILLVFNEKLSKQSWGCAVSFLLLLLSWITLYTVFRIIVRYHVDKLKVEREKALADQVRKSVRASDLKGLYKHN